MKTKSIWPVFFILFLVFSQCVFSAEQAGRAPEYTVKQFYSWYLKKEDAQDFPVLDQKIFDFVCKKNVEKLRNNYRNNKLDDVDYFTKVQDFDLKDWESHTVIARPVITDNMAKISVTFGSSDKVTVLISLKQEAGAWKIFKVESAQK